MLVKMMKAKEMPAVGVALSKGAGKAETTIGEVVAIGWKNVDRNGKEASHGIEVGNMVRFRRRKMPRTKARSSLSAQALLTRRPALLPP